MKGIRIFVSPAKNLIIKNIPSKFGITFLLFFSICPILFSKADQGIGKASYYANKFQGKKTASGEKYDKNKFTAAHRTYAFGTKLKVTNIKTGTWVQVYVNDRGPYAKDRLIDLSYAAALAIGMIQSGIIQVKIERIDNEIELPPPIVKKEEAQPLGEGFYSSKLEHIQRPKGYLLQLGSFSSYEHAAARINDLNEHSSLGTACIEITVVKKKKMYRVLYSGFPTKQKITREQKELKKKGFDSIIISPK